MKFNWGIGITIWIIAFMGFILFMVAKSFSTNTDLNAENYYEQEIDFQTHIDAVKNGVSFQGKFTFSQDSEYIKVSFPSGFPMDFASGQIHFYRPDNASLDRVFEMEPESQLWQLFSKKEVLSGGYLVKFSWINGTEEFYTEQNVVIN
ncbi:MAG: FixH family protein [Flavobacteriales bacterium]